jgi:hypothetical protein
LSFRHVGDAISYPGRRMPVQYQYTIIKASVSLCDYFSRVRDSAGNRGRNGRGFLPFTGGFFSSFLCSALSVEYSGGSVDRVWHAAFRSRRRFRGIGCAPCYIFSSAGSSPHRVIRVHRIHRVRPIHRTVRIERAIEVIRMPGIQDTVRIIPIPGVEWVPRVVRITRAVRIRRMPHRRPRWPLCVRQHPGLG